MATPDVPGSNPANHDKLSIGNWAEHEDGSLILIIGIDENDTVVFNLYDLDDADHPVFYPNAMTLKEFEKTFSFDPKKKISDKNLKWTWHDKTPFAWQRVMSVFKKPQPVLANVDDTLSAAKRLKRSLDLRMTMPVTPEHVHSQQGLTLEDITAPAQRIFQRLKRAMAAFKDPID